MTEITEIDYKHNVRKEAHRLYLVGCALNGMLASEHCNAENKKLIRWAIQLADQTLEELYPSSQG